MQFLGDNRWLIFVLPGFFSLFVAGFVSDFPEIRDSQLPIVYIALTALSVSIPLGTLHFYGRITGHSFHIDLLLRRPAFVFSIFVTSVVLGFVFGIVHTTDIVSRELRTIFGKDIVLTSSQSEVLKVLFKLSYSDGFADELDGQPHVSREVQEFRNKFVRVNFGKKRNSYEGVVTSFYEGSQKPQVYLSPACLISASGVVPVKGPGVWLNLEQAEDIQFIYSACSECANQIEIASGKQPQNNCPIH